MWQRTARFRSRHNEHHPYRKPENRTRPYTQKYHFPCIDQFGLDIVPLTLSRCYPTPWRLVLALLGEASWIDHLLTWGKGIAFPQYRGDGEEGPMVAELAMDCCLTKRGGGCGVHSKGGVIQIHFHTGSFREKSQNRNLTWVTEEEAVACVSKAALAIRWFVSPRGQGCGVM